jgi:hypothetical protein
MARIVGGRAPYNQDGTPDRSTKAGYASSRQARLRMAEAAPARQAARTTAARAGMTEDQLKPTKPARAKYKAGQAAGRTMGFAQKLATRRNLRAGGAVIAGTAAVGSGLAVRGRGQRRHG